MKLKQGIYKHYKKGLFRFVIEAKCEETGIDLVVYECVETETVLSRPKIEFLQKYKWQYNWV